MRGGNAGVMYDYVVIGNGEGGRTKTTTENGAEVAEVIDFIEGFNFNLGSAIECIARAGHNPGNGILADLEKPIGIWNVKSNGSKTSAMTPCRRPNLRLSDSLHRSIDSTSVNTTAPYGKTGWATNTDSAAVHGNIRLRAKTIGNQYGSLRSSPTLVHTHHS